jgi:hypothetical protein
MQETQSPKELKEQMKKQILFAVLLAALAFVGLCAYLAVEVNRNPTEKASNEAFRDGISSATQDAQRGEEPHFVLAHWSTQADQAAFVEGYKVAYERTLPVFEQDMTLASAAYCDGLYVGKLDAQQGREAHAGVGRWSEQQDKELFASGYRRAYLETVAALVQNHPASQTVVVLKARN